MLRLAALLTLAVFAPALALDGVFISAELTLFGNGVVPCTSHVHTAIMASLPDALPGVVVVGISLTDPKVRGPQRAPNSVPAGVPGAAPAAAGAPNSGTHPSVINPSGPCPSIPTQVHQTNWQQARRCGRTNASQAEVASQARMGLYPLAATEAEEGVRRIPVVQATAGAGGSLPGCRAWTPHEQIFVSDFSTMVLRTEGITLHLLAAAQVNRASGQACNRTGGDRGLPGYGTSNCGALV